MNRLYFGDNLEIMREMELDHIDLICTDPPFNSGRDYNAFFQESKAQEKAFTDIWQWDKDAIESRQDIRSRAGADDTYKALDMCLEGYDLVLQNAVKGNKGSMRAYLTFMGPRLAEMHRLLRNTGSIYLHCDPAASHYLKGIMDAIWDQQNNEKNEFYRNEIVWQRTHAHSDGGQYGRIHDVILFYKKSSNAIWNPVYIAHDPKYVENNYPHKDKWGHYQRIILTAPGITKKGESGKSWRGVNPTNSGKGRHWAAPERTSCPEHVELPDNYESLSVHQKLDILDANELIYFPSRGKNPRFKKYLSTSEGRRIQDIITDIGKVSGDEDLGYDTQKPIALYERMIAASSNPNSLVLDPFCGCGTTIDAAHTLKRTWIGIDLTIIALDPISKRMQDRHANSAGEPLEPHKDYEIIGYPTNMQEVYKLVRDQEKRHDFANWAVTRLGMTPTPDVKDKGKDGIGQVMLYEPEAQIETSKRIVSEVKTGGFTINDVRAFCYTINEQNAVAGVFITLDPVTKDMRQIAADMGEFELENNKRYPRLVFWQVDDTYFENPDMLRRTLRLPYDWIQPRKKSDRHFYDQQLEML